MLSRRTRKVKSKVFRPKQLRMREEIPIRDLLDRCLSSEDEGLWLAFVRRTQPMMANVIMNTVRRWKEPNPSLVDDLLQEAFLKLFANDRKSLRSIRNAHENTIFGYLRVVAGNVARDYFRSPQNRIEEIEVSDPVIPPSPDGWDRIAFNRLKDQIQARLDSLSSSETYRARRLDFLALLRTRVYRERGFLDS